MRQFSPISLTAFLIGGVTLCGCGGTGTLGTQQSLTTPGLSQPSSPARSAKDGSKIPAATAQAAIFLTDSNIPSSATTGKFGDAYDRVYITLHKIELLDVPVETKTTGQEIAQTLWEDAEGVAVDVKSLHDSSGAYSRLLALAPLPPTKSYTRVRLTFGKTVLLFAANANRGDNAVFAPTVARDAEGKPVVSFAFERPVTFGANDANVVVDFDLNAFVRENDAIVPIVRAGKANASLDSARQESVFFAGSVSGVAGEGEKQTFLLTTAKGTAGAQFTRRTLVYNSNSKPNASLAEKQSVTVRGVYDITARKIVADSVEIGAPGGTAALVGDVRDVKPKSQTFAVAPGLAQGLVPIQSAIQVTLTDDAVLRSKGGLLLSPDTFFAAIADKNAQVALSGSYDAAMNTFTATRAKIEGKISGGRETALSGTIAVSGDDLTLSAPDTWEGLLAPPAKEKNVNVNLSAATTYTDEKGAFLSRETLRGRVQKSANARVMGLMDAKGIVMASRVELLPEREKPIVAEVAPAPEPSTTPKATTERPGKP